MMESKSKLSSENTEIDAFKLMKLFEKTSDSRFFININQLLDPYIQTELQNLDVIISDIENIQFELNKYGGTYMLEVSMNYINDNAFDEAEIILTKKKFKYYLKSMLQNYSKGNGFFEVITENKYNFTFKNNIELKKQLNKLEI
jgi:hypothetical protein